jgi:sensor histidine kinase YesM
MIQEHLIHFLIIITIQVLFFFGHALLVGEKKNVGRYLLLGALVGLPFGIIFDLLVGMLAGVFTYTIGFPLWFLVINGLFSYGFMFANVFLLQNHSIGHMFLWAGALGVVYEASNYLFPIWEWTFGADTSEYIIVVCGAYFGLTWIMMCMLQLLFGTQFKIVPFSFSFIKESKY